MYFKNTKVFTSFSVDDIQKAREFYGKILGLHVEEQSEGLAIHLLGGGEVFIYPKPNHTPATFTVLNFSVENIEKTFDSLMEKGIAFEQYEGLTDEKGIGRGISQGRGPDIAWFKDTAGNILSILQEK